MTHSPTPPGPSLGTWSESMGFRLRPPTKRFTFLVGTPHRAILPWACYCRIDPLGLNQNAWWTPHRAILPWARYCRIDPLGLNQNAWWTDLLLATSLNGQLRKGQFSSHRSADRCTLNILPVTGHTGYGSRPGTRYHPVMTRYPVPGRPGASVTPSTPVTPSALVTPVSKLKRYRPTCSKFTGQNGTIRTKCL